MEIISYRESNEFKIKEAILCQNMWQQVKLYSKYNDPRISNL